MHPEETVTKFVGIALQNVVEAKIYAAGTLYLGACSNSRRGTRSGSGSRASFRSASSSRRRVSWPAVRLASRRSHRVINSSSLATMRCCSMIGGRGTVKARNGRSAIVGCAVPVVLLDAWSYTSGEANNHIRN